MTKTTTLLLLLTAACMNIPRIHAFAPTYNPKSCTNLSAKASKTKKAKSKKSQTASSGIRGFGGTSTQTTKSTKKDALKTTIDRSKPTMEFYKYMQEFSPVAAANLKRVAIGLCEVAPGIAIRGVVTLKPIAKGEEILCIPYELALNLGREGNDPTLPAYTLQQEICKKDSNKQSYLNLLPKFNGSDMLGSTDFFSENALEALQYPPMVRETIERRNRTTARFERDVEPMLHISPELFSYQNNEVTQRHLQWCVWLITSRVLTVQGSAESNEAYRLMIPLLDMCNHDRSSPHILSGRAVPGGLLKVVAGKNLEAGEQVNICYGGGVAGNDRFLQDYGFLDDFNGSTNKEEAYDIVARQVLGLHQAQPQQGASMIMSFSDRNAILEALQGSSVEEDEVLLLELKDDEENEDVKAAVRFRIGVKKALERCRRAS